MSIPKQASRFEQDRVHLVVDQYAGSEPIMATSFCEDLRYWSDGTEDPIGDDKVYLRLPQAASFIPVEARDGLEQGTLYLPPEWIQKVGITYVPAEIEFLVTRPSFSSQLERFH